MNSYIKFKENPKTHTKTRRLLHICTSPRRMCIISSFVLELSCSKDKIEMKAEIKKTPLRTHVQLTISIQHLRLHIVTSINTTQPTISCESQLSCKKVLKVIKVIKVIKKLYTFKR